MKFAGSEQRFGHLVGRSPYGERGLKFAGIRLIPVRASRSPYGERGLKLAGIRLFPVRASRSPYGERGLKYSAR